MCDACASRAKRLRLLSAEFEDLARKTIEPFFAARYARTAAELIALADGLVCGTDDVVWAEDNDAGDEADGDALGPGDVILFDS